MYGKDSLRYNTSKRYVQKYLFLLLLIPIFVICFRLFIQQGAVINGDFPSFEVSVHSFERLWLWVDKGSYSGFENLARFPMIGIWALLSLFSVGFAASTKFMIILGFSLCSFSFYFSFYYLLKDKIGSTSPLRLRIALIIGSLFFTYNVWSFNRIDHYYLWIGYSILPIFFVSLVYSFKYFRIKHVVIAALTSIIASSTPHMVIFYGIVLIITFLSFFVYYIIKRKSRSLIYSTTTVVALFSLFIVLNLYWVLPYILSSFSESNFIGPTYVLNLEITDVLSRDSDFFNTLTLTADWINYGVYFEPSPPTSILHSVWMFSSFLFPVLALISFALWIKRVKYSLILFVFFVIGFILAMGTNVPFDYFSILFSTPILGKIAWVFRDPDKWSFLIAFSYSFFLTLFSVFVFNLFSNKYAKNLLISSVFVILIVSSVAIFAYPVYNYTMDERYNSIKLPDDFAHLNKYLSTLDTKKVFFMPYSDTFPYWSINHTVTGIYELESLLPSNQMFYPVQKNYYNYFTQSIQNNQTKDIGNFIYPFGTSYLIYHNDTVSDYDMSFLDRVYNLSDLQHHKNIGFFDVFKLPKNQTPVDIMNTNNNIAIVQGLDKLSLLDKINTFSTANSSVLFLDQNPLQKVDLLNYFNNVVLEPSFLNLMFSFIPNQYFLSPFDYTFHNNGAMYWSKVNAIDSLQGEFHPYLDPINIDNWDLDYGKGIVITQTSGAKLDIPVEISMPGNTTTVSTSNTTNTTPFNKDKDNSKYDLFIRYLENYRGGNIRVFLDDKQIDEISTQGSTDEFIWKKIWSSNLTPGHHKLSIENSNGLNAINTFALVPENQFEKTKFDILDKASTMKLIYLLNQADFDSLSNKPINNGNTSELEIPLFNSSTSTTNTSITSLDMSKAQQSPNDLVFNGTIRIPQVTDIDNNDLNSLVLNFKTTLLNKSSSSTSFLSSPDPIRANLIKSIDLIPFSQKIVYDENFENTSNPFEIFGDEMYSVSTEADSPISGSNSLKIFTNKSNPENTDVWNFLQTDYIPVDANTNLNFKSKVKAYGVYALHPKIGFYTSNNTLLGENVLADSMDGTFDKNYDIDIVPPRNTAFVQISFLFLPNSDTNSSFLLDDTKLVETVPSIHIRDLDPNDEFHVDSSSVQLTRNDANSSDALTLITQTRPLPIVNNMTYNYDVEINSENVSSVSSYALLGALNKHDDVVDGNTNNNTRYSLLKDLDIIKSGNYHLEFLIRDNNTLTNNQSHIFIDGVEMTTQTLYTGDTLEGSTTLSPSQDMYSLFLDIYLDKGTHKLELGMPDTQSKLDLALIYSVNDKDSNNNSKLLFEDQTNAAILNDYQKINPTKHVVKIENATKPFVLLFSETYDPLWIATIITDDSGDKTDDSNQQIFNVPLSSVVNGFLINKTGSYDVAVEYKPQDWFYLGLYVSISSLIILVIATLFYYSRTNKTKKMN